MKLSRVARNTRHWLVMKVWFPFFRHTPWGWWFRSRFSLDPFCMELDRRRKARFKPWQLGYWK